LNNTLLNDQWVVKETIKEIKMFLEFNNNENTTYQNLWDTAKAILRVKFKAMSTYIKNTERSQINYLMLYLKLLEKEEQANPKTSRRREIIMRTKINEIEMKNKQTSQKNIQRSNETKSWFLKK
jgi:hypothetical protein